MSDAGEAPVRIEPLTLWLTDRSRYVNGTGRCRMLRYLQNHFGPTGYGIVRSGDSLPLATGQHAHLAIEILLKILQQYDRLPTREEIRGAIAQANGAYGKRVAQRGYAGLLQSESSDRVVREQCTLIEGLIWAFCRLILPWMHANYRIVEVEREGIYMLGCTCGLSSAIDDAAAHDARGCQGIAMMLRQDCLAERRIGGGLAYFEFKTTGWGNDTWASQWETRPQLAIGNWGVNERLGKEIVENYIIGLYKGSRKKVEDPFEGIWYRQESPLCYAFVRPSNPPLATEDWLPQYEWTDEDGNKKRASRAHQKAGIWTLEESDWPEWVEGRGDQSPSEFWVNYLPPSVVEKQIFMVGPLNRQDQQIAALKTQVFAEEKDWQQRLWKLYEFAEATGSSWGSPIFMQEVDALFPASWDCRRFGARSECEMKKLCFRESGWEDPLSNGFVPRRPHHTPELEQAVGRGLLPEQSEEEDLDED
jgi:hypothetical protein